MRIEHEVGRASVEVHFTDAAVSRPIKLIDRLSFSLGSVSSTLLALASESHLHVRPVQQVTHNAEWSISLQEGEQFIALAVGTCPFHRRV